MKRQFRFSWKGLTVTLGILLLASAICAVLKPISSGDFHVPLIFVLAVLVVSWFTEGYLFGLIACCIAVIGVNVVFTYPYYKMDFSLTGYPLTFICMFAVSVITSTLTSRVRETERIRRESERETMRANLLRAISHDFRTPLTSIIGSVNTVRESGSELEPEKKDQLLSDAAGEAEWLINMVENLLSITRIGADPQDKLHTEPQAVEEVVYEAVTRFRRQYPEFRADIRIPAELLMVEMDAVLIEQVILNLLINAAIHGRGATGAVLSVKRDGDMAEFAVTDNGTGFTGQALQHLFDGNGFRGAHGSGEDSGRTMGIGLSVCNTIIAAHGGTMAAKNAPEGGACVSFRLPVCEEAAFNLEEE